MSLHLSQLDANGTKIGSGTGFVVTDGSDGYLVTARHVLTGVNADTGTVLCPGPQPSSIEIQYHSKSNLLRRWIPVVEPLMSPDSRRLWYGYPSDDAERSRKIDIAALPLSQSCDDACCEAVDIRHLSIESSFEHGTEVIPSVASPVSIVGFWKRGLFSGELPVWKTGHIASEPLVDYDGNPLFLVDANTQQGMSGSPVFQRVSTGYKTPGRHGVVNVSEPVTQFLGVYSSRWTATADNMTLGRVWKPTAVIAIIKSIAKDRSAGPR